jgi:hypothetical protein
MLSTKAERRRKRSHDPHTALSLQLAHVLEQAKLAAVVLASEDGLLIAHAGDTELCSELAALAPVVSLSGALPSNTNLGHGLVHVQTVPWEGAPLYLAGCGEGSEVPRWQDMSQWIARAQAGVTRILAA